MANSDPMHGFHVVQLDHLPSAHVEIVRDILAGSLAGVEDDLSSGNWMPNPGRARRDADAYRRMLAALESGELAVPDEEARRAIAEIAEGRDKGNEYQRVVAEHDALHGLLAAISTTEGRR